jgi:hypothetical protein
MITIYVTCFSHGNVSILTAHCVPISYDPRTMNGYFLMPSALVLRVNFDD